MSATSTSPATLGWNMLGNAWAVEMLRRHIEHNAVRHAYLFAGPPGVGRRTLALRFAQALNCSEPVAAGVPCGGRCRDCRQIQSLQHPDVSIIEADSEGGTLKVEQVRELRHNLSLKPYQSAYRVALFLRFQETSDSAANALLKTLEEAPSYAVLILTADNAEQLLPTILSRCEVLRLAPAPLEEVETLLKQNGAADHQARLIAHISAGRPGFALRLLHEPAALQLRDERLSELQSLIAATRAQKFAYAEKMSKDRAALRQVLTLWVSFWRDVLWRASGASTPPVNIDRQQLIESLAKDLGLADVRRVVSGLDSAVTQLDGNVNARLLTEVVLLDWPQ